MSSTSAPISLHRFAEAITDLPFSNLHFKAAEIRNAIAHLESSNQELQVFADEGDQDCADAVRENREVVRRMEERVLLLKREVEKRGYIWGEDEGKEANSDGDTEMSDVERQTLGGAEENRQGAHPSVGRLGDEELSRRLREPMQERGQEDDDGVHL